MTLAEKIRKARESKIEAGGRAFVIRRPTDEEASDAAARGDGMLAIVKRFTIGWEMNEIDLIPGGSPVPVPFDAETFAEWVADQPELWVPIAEAVLSAYMVHKERRGAAVKN